MHSFGYRANALLTFSLTILALMCAMASLSDNLNSPSPTASVKVLNINRFQKKSTGDDEVGITLDISADLQSLFTWNTKQVFVFLAAEYSTPKNILNQVSLWDGIIPAQDGAKFSIKTKNKYRFIDQGSNLRGRDFNLTLHWHVMPKTGKMFADKLVLPGFRLPEFFPDSDPSSSHQFFVSFQLYPSNPCSSSSPKNQFVLAWFHQNSIAHHSPILELKSKPLFHLLIIANRSY
ncbi:unnamed protein product [Lactuca virosa]|uniref:Signal peptidase complex subunit 3 n=1 Tax=Lactuca virosa TaxID=75947 RepID=A0AAU9NGF8_9ASTR|nr:unnamed protein product [Lactuca virosa]